MYGGYALLGLLTRGGLTPFQETFFRAGHGHAGVLLLMSLLYHRYMEQTSLSPVLKVIFAGYPAIVVIRLLVLRSHSATDGRRQTTRSVRPAGWIAATSLVSMLGMFCYFGYLLFTNEDEPGPTVFGRPVPWIVLQLFAVSYIALLVATYAAWWRARRDTGGWLWLWLELSLAGGWLFIPWALYWGLRVP